MTAVVIGTCGHCGGRVTVPTSYLSMIPPTPRCELCGRVPVQARLPVLPMEEPHAGGTPPWFRRYRTG